MEDKCRLPDIRLCRNFLDLIKKIKKKKVPTGTFFNSGLDDDNPLVLPVLQKPEMR